MASKLHRPLGTHRFIFDSHRIYCLVHSMESLIIALEYVIANIDKKYDQILIKVYAFVYGNAYFNCVITMNA